MNNSKKDGLSTLITVVVILAVLALAVFATYSKIAKNIKNNAIANGTAPETIEYAAEQADLTVEDYLAQYGLAVSDEVNGKTLLTDMYGYMTLENYMALANEGSEEELDLDAIIGEWGLTDQITKDTQWKDVEPLIPVGSYFGEEQLAQYKEAYGLGDEVTAETSYGDFQKIMEEKIAQMQATEAPTEEPASETQPAE